MSLRLLAARTLLCSSERWVEGGGLLVEQGRVRAVLASRAAVRRAATAEGVALEDHDGLLAPGFVNAHAHLELTGLADCLPRGGTLPEWIGALLPARATRGPAALEADVRAGAARLVATGTTTVADVDSTGAAERVAATLGVRVVLFRELLDAADPVRTAAALERVRRALPRRARVTEGLSPHAPYTVSDELLAAVARLARRRRLPVTVHWAETEDELLWADAGTGAFARVLAHRPRGAGLERLVAAGLAGPRTSLVHANFPRGDEPERVAASGASVVHCPGAHAWFARAPFPLARWRAAGVPVALGTDSRAGNDDLDLRRELALFRAAFPDLPPAAAFAAATTDAARAVGLAGAVGELAPAAHADLCHWPLAPASRETALEALTSGAPAPAAVWIGGHRAALGGLRGAAAGRAGRPGAG